MNDSDIERRIVTGLIVSDEFMRRVQPFWQDGFIESPEISQIARWCLDYFTQYNTTPKQHIEDLFLHEMRSDHLGRAEGELIEGVLAKIRDEFERGTQYNAEYLFDRALEYFRKREFIRHTEEVQDLVDRGDIAAADDAVRAFKPLSVATSRGLEVGSEEGLKRLAAAFVTTTVPVVKLPGSIGDMLNEHLVRDGFIGFTGPEKRGKTWILLELAMQGIMQRANVAFFQAGDLTEGQFLRRLGIWKAGRSDMSQYCRPHWYPVGDCVFNQIDQCPCPKSGRDQLYEKGEEPLCIFEGVSPQQYKETRSTEVTFDALVKLAEDLPGYKPCASTACSKRWPTAFFQKTGSVPPLTGVRAEKEVGRFFKQYRRRFKLNTYPSGTLDTDEINACLDEWERQDDFVPDLIVVDYADIMTAPGREFRHQQNEIWKGLRGISQRRHALVVTATQADAASYRTSTLTLGNFSEDKRKYAHVTAMFGLNQAPGGEEKKMGLIRINALLVREGELPSWDVTVMQDLSRGRPFIGSFSARARQRNIEEE